MKFVLPIVTGILLSLSSTFASAHSCSSAEVKRGCWEERNGQGTPQCYCSEPEARFSSQFENSEDLDSAPAKAQISGATDLIVIHASNGRALGSLSEIVGAAKSAEASSPGSCSSRNCEWIGFCYCGGAGGKR